MQFVFERRVQTQSRRDKVHSLEVSQVVKAGGEGLNQILGFHWILSLLVVCRHRNLRPLVGLLVCLIGLVLHILHLDWLVLLNHLRCGHLRLIVKRGATDLDHGGSQMLEAFELWVGLNLRNCLLNHILQNVLELNDLGWVVRTLQVQELLKVNTGEIGERRFALIIVGEGRSIGSILILMLVMDTSSYHRCRCSSLAREVVELLCL